ncbi:hypothetical protein BKA70DRAFT_1325985 [Coprinopsis sp. MPI-PUGE-AT-0042]|nr:hypothetical protein BKA70DRAFT_1325985 [Coprinopsis sp. MPI-PUGE-AT-0042]
MVYVVLRKCTQQLACFSPFNHHPADILIPHSSYAFYKQHLPPPRTVMYAPPEPTRRGIVQALHPRRAAAERIPAEVWLQIFITFAQFAPSSHLSPIKLTHITHGLRRLAHGAAELWSTFCVTENRRGRLPCSSIVYRWLSCAASRPGPSSVRSASVLMQTLLAFAQSWGQLIVHGPWMSGMPAWGSFNNAQPDPSQKASHPRALFFQDLIAHSPNLRDFRFAWTGGQNTGHKLTRGFSQIFALPSRLTALKLFNPIEVPELVGILATLSALEECEIQNLLPFNPYAEGTGPPGTFSCPPPGTQICLPNLHSLKVYVEDIWRRDWSTAGCVIATLLPSLLAPSLRALLVGREKLWCPEPLVTFLDTSRCTLRSLTFDFIPITTQDLESVLRRSGRLEELTDQNVQRRVPFTSVSRHFSNPLQPEKPDFFFNATALAGTRGWFSRMVRYRVCSRHRVLHEPHKVQGIPDFYTLVSLRQAGLEFSVIPDNDNFDW